MSVYLIVTKQSAKMDLNSLFTLPKFDSNLNVITGTFGAIVLNACKEKGVEIISLTKHEKDSDIMVVRFEGKIKSHIKRGGNCNKILKQIGVKIK